MTTRASNVALEKMSGDRDPARLDEGAKLIQLYLSAHDLTEHACTIRVHTVTKYQPADV